MTLLNIFLEDFYNKFLNAGDNIHLKRIILYAFSLKKLFLVFQIQTTIFLENKFDLFKIDIEYIEKDINFAIRSEEILKINEFLNNILIKQIQN